MCKYIPETAGVVQPVHMRFNRNTATINVSLGFVDLGESGRVGQSGERHASVKVHVNEGMWRASPPLPM